MRKIKAIDSSNGTATLDCVHAVTLGTPKRPRQNALQGFWRSFTDCSGQHTTLLPLRIACSSNNIDITHSPGYYRLPLRAVCRTVNATHPYSRQTPDASSNALPPFFSASVSYAGATEPPPGEGFDPFEREVHGPTIILDDRAGKVRVNDSAGNIDVWTCHFRWGQK